MKIIHVVLGKANPDRMNGVTKIAYQLAKTQHEMGYDVAIWGIANSLDHNYPPRPFPTELFRQSKNKLRLDSNMLTAVKKLQTPVVLHLHGAFIPEFYHLSKLLRASGIGYIYTPHGSLTAGAMAQSKWRKKIYFSLFERSLIQYSKAIQISGDQGYQYIDKLMAAPQKILIANGMDWDELPQLPKKNKGPHPVFNFCGRLDIYHKGLDLMLDGFHLFLEKGHQAQLELIGDGKDRKALEQQTQRLGMTSNVVFHGAKYGDDKFQHMAAGDIFLHTSRNEGFPMAVVEAAALGLPCLTSEPTSFNRFIRKYNAGFALSENHSPKSICEAMEAGLKAFHSGGLEELGNNAKKMVKAEFDWRIICQQLVKVYTAEQYQFSAVA